MARYLSPEWVQSFDAALSALDLTDAIAAAGEGSLAAADGAFSVAQVVQGVPGEAGDVHVRLSVADGHVHLARVDGDTPATATIVLGYADALALSTGELDAADALADGRVLAATWPRWSPARKSSPLPRRSSAPPWRASTTRRTRDVARARPPDFGGRYAGRVAVVTGASAGLGAQLCRDLAHAGAVVVGLARNTERLEELKVELQKDSPSSYTITCDVAETDALRRALHDVAASKGPIDLLVNNAAIDPGVRLVDITEADFRRTLDVNFFAPVAATLAVIDTMAERGHGIIVNVSSDGGRLPSPGPGAYPSSKAALSAFSESISFRLGPEGGPRARRLPRFHADRGWARRSGPRPAPAAPPDHPQCRNGVTPDPGPGRRPLARDQRLGADRRSDGVPHRHAPHLPPVAPQLVGGH